MRRPRSSAFISFDGWLWPAIVSQTDGLSIAFDSNPAYTLRLDRDRAIRLNGCDGALFLGELEGFATLYRHRTMLTCTKPLD